MVEDTRELIVQVFQVGLRIGFAVFVTVTEQFILPRQHIPCLNILHGLLPEIGQYLRLDDTSLMLPGVLLQTGFHVLLIQLVEVLEQHIEVAALLEKKSALPILSLTLCLEATLILQAQSQLR